MMDDLDEYMYGGASVDEIIARRRANANRLAAKFPEMRGLSLVDCMMRLDSLGISLDVITMSAFHKALNQPTNGAAAP